MSVFTEALKILLDYPGRCDRSCYRCLRSYKNKFDHEYIDRHVGAALLEYLLSGSEPKWAPSRLDASRNILFEDLKRNSDPNLALYRYHPITLYGSIEMTAPICLVKSDGTIVVIDVSGAMTPGLPSDPELAKYIDQQTSFEVLLVEELMVRRNLPEASRIIREGLRL